ncbi:two-component system response regulator RssB [Xenorhabdus szentirmaii]|nr:two-component system response regulator RssB [Xenorhabdus szentirmaii]
MFEEACVMEKVLRGKKILVIEDEPVFCSSLADYLNSLGAIITCASNGEMALRKVETETTPELIFCDLNMPIMNGLEFIKRMTIKGETIPIIIVSATNKMMQIDNALRLGAKDILLKPISNFNEIKKIALNYLNPDLSAFEAMERKRLDQELMILQQNAAIAWRLLKQLQPPVSQIIANCRVNYRLLNTVGKPGLVFDVTTLSEKEIMFYCLDISYSKGRGWLSALLLRVAFNDLLKRMSAYKNNGIPDMQKSMSNLKRTMRDGRASESLPLLLGYYNTDNKTILLSSVGLNADVKLGGCQKQLEKGSRYDSLKIINPNQDRESRSFWQCKIWDNENQIKLMFSSPSQP